MGGGSSTQKRVTIEEDGGSGTVKVSEAVARRLLGQPEPEDSKSSSEEDISGFRPTDNQEDAQRWRGFYERRIAALEKKNKDLHQTSADEFAKAVEEVENRYLNATGSPVCQEFEEEVLKCYHANSKATLFCSPQVQAFRDCVQKQREKILARRG